MWRFRAKDAAKYVDLSLSFSRAGKPLPGFRPQTDDFTCNQILEEGKAFELGMF